MPIKPNSQNARILRALSDGKWHSVASIHRRAGPSRLNSRISELRSHGYVIEHEHVPVPGKRGPVGHRYRLTNPPAADELAAIIDPIVSEAGLRREEVPRDMTHRFRIYRMVYEELELLATATAPADVGEAIVELGREGLFAQSCVGILDTHGSDEVKGEWVVNPFDSTPL